MKDKTFYVYAHFTKDTNELFYIGVGTGYRIYEKKKRNQIWQRIANKHGFDAYIIVGDFVNRNDAVKEEVRLQFINKPRACIQYGDRLDSIVSDETRKKQSEKRKGEKNGMFGRHHSEETRKRWSEIRKGRTCIDKGKKRKPISEEHKRKLSEGNKGKVISEEVRKKMSEAAKNKVFSEEHRRKMGEVRKGKRTGGENANSKKVMCIETGIVFQSVGLAAESIQRNRTCVGDCCRGKQKTAGGYTWKYVD